MRCIRSIILILIATQFSPSCGHAANIKYHECEVRWRDAKRAQDRRIQEALNRSGYRFHDRDNLTEELEKAAEELRRVLRDRAGNNDL
jgi:hypothetical protein